MKNSVPFLFGQVFPFLLVIFLILSPVIQVYGASMGKIKTSTSQLKKAILNYPKLVIGSGDILSVFVYGENEVSGSAGIASNSQLPTEYQVDSDGIILFPFLGRVKLEGLTPVEASEKIAKLLSKPRKVSVLIKESNTYWVSILGNVAKPGRYQIIGKPTLLSLLGQAGGPLPGTDMGGAILIHSDMKLKVNLDKFLTGEGRMEAEPFLYPGDTLMVKKSSWPDLGSFAIVASILASVAVVAVELSQPRNP